MSFYRAVLPSLLCLAATAQDLPLQKTLPIDVAVKIAQGAMDRCKADGFKVSVTIVDTAGHVKVQMRGDGTGPHTLEHGKRKAYTAMTFKRSSAETLKLWSNSGNIPLIEATVAAAGGVPIRAGMEIIGGIGVSGAPVGAQDEVCADEGIKKAAAQLK